MIRNVVRSPVLVVLHKHRQRSELLCTAYDLDLLQRRVHGGVNHAAERMERRVGIPKVLPDLLDAARLAQEGGELGVEEERVDADELPQPRRAQEVLPVDACMRGPKPERLDRLGDAGWRPKGWRKVDERECSEELALLQDLVRVGLRPVRGLAQQGLAVPAGTGWSYPEVTHVERRRGRSRDVTGHFAFGEAASEPSDVGRCREDHGLV